MSGSSGAGSALNRGSAPASGASQGTGGIPVPFPQQVEFGQLAGTPGIAGNINPVQNTGLQGLHQFAGGDFGNSPAVQQAVQGLQQQIIPQVQNQYAQMGLGASGALGNQIGRSYAQQLVPLYQQGMTNQLAASQNLNQAGSDITNRQIQANLGAAPQLFQLGAAEEARPTTALAEQQQAGGTQRAIQTAQSQANLDSYLRQREMALGLVNPFGSFSVVSALPQTTQVTQPTGSGLFK